MFWSLEQPEVNLNYRMIALGRRWIGLLLLGATIIHAQAQDLEPLKAGARDLHSRGSNVKVTMRDGSVLRGHILRVDSDAFTLQQKSTPQETPVQYAQVKEIKKDGKGGKAILIPAAIGGGVLLVLCVAPYPIGFLCRKDPS